MSAKLAGDDVDKILNQLKLVAAVALIIVLVPLTCYVFFLENRLASFESSLEHSPPQELVADERQPRDFQTRWVDPSEGQWVYVPVYSHVYNSDRKPLLLTITLSVRNTSRDQEITINAVQYFNTKGKMVRSYLEKPVRLPAMGTTEILVDREDVTGGSGANFLVQWSAQTAVTEPLVEAVMIDTRSQPGVSFVRRGVVISENLPENSSTSDSVNQDQPATETPQ